MNRKPCLRSTKVLCYIPCLHKTSGDGILKYNSIGPVATLPRTYDVQVISVGWPFFLKIKINKRKFQLLQVALRSKPLKASYLELSKVGHFLLSNTYEVYEESFTRGPFSIALILTNMFCLNHSTLVSYRCFGSISIQIVYLFIYLFLDLINSLLKFNYLFQE